MRFLEDALAAGVRSPDERDGRVYGWLLGIVTDVDTKLGRVKARIAKQEDADSSDWLVPLLPGVIESVPRTNDPVAVFFMDGDPHRGAYLYFPQSTTQNRPSEAMILGATFVGMFNYLVTQFNQLRADFNNHGHSAGTMTSPSGSVTGVTSAAKSPALNTVAGTPGNGVTATSASDANKGKASDGSVVSDKATSETVLSGRAKVGI